jgi:hypothetical protein
MKRKAIIGLGGFLAVGFVLCGAWALVQAQTAPAANNQPKGGGRSSDTVGKLLRSPGAASSSGAQQRAGSSDNSLFKSMMSGPGSGMAMIMAAPDDPEMAQLAEAEGELARTSEDLLSQYAATDKAEEQKRLKTELRETLAKQFDVQRQRRELELARVEERIKKVREQLKKRNDARDTIIDRRLEQLINDADGLGWTGPGGTSTRSGAGNLFRNDFQNRPATSPRRE